MAQPNGKSKKVFSLTMVFLVLFSMSAIAGGGPKYKNAKTKIAISKMIEAHGGMVAWQEVPSMSFDNVIYITPDAFPVEDGMSEWFVWDVSRETVDFNNLRAYKKILPDNGEILTAGGKVWTNRLNQNNIDEGMPLRFKLWHHTGFLNLPWLTQQDDIILEELNPGRLPDDNTNYIVVEMRFDNREQHLEEEYIKLYIDPNSFVLKATEYQLVFSALNDGIALPEGAGCQIPPMLRINDEFVVVDGLRVPSRYTTYDPSKEKLFGYHLIMHVSFSEEFDETLFDSEPMQELGSIQETLKTD